MIFLPRNYSQLISEKVLENCKQRTFLGKNCIVSANFEETMLILITGILVFMVNGILSDHLKKLI